MHTQDVPIVSGKNGLIGPLHDLRGQNGRGPEIETTKFSITKKRKSG